MLLSVASASGGVPPLGAGAHWPREADLISFCQQVGPGTAAVLLALGLVFLLWGFPAFKFLVMLNCGAVGAYLGASVGKNTDTIIAGAVIGGFLCAALAWPLMRWAVALMGAAIGMVVGAAIWRAAGQDLAFDWAGGLTGFVAFGMLSFILFRGAIMLYTALQGAGFVVSGLMGLLYKYPTVAPKVTEALHVRPFILPATIILTAVVGLIYQHHQTSVGGGGGSPKKPGK